MPRKKKETVVDDPKAMSATVITPVEGVGPFKKTTEPFSAEEANEFQRMCINVSSALKTPLGTKLNCRVKVLVENKEAIVYQGLIGNVWARVRANGRHNVYRHALKTLLIADEKTKEYFS